MTSGDARDVCCALGLSLYHFVVKLRFFFFFFFFFLDLNMSSPSLNFSYDSGEQHELRVSTPEMLPPPHQPSFDAPYLEEFDEEWKIWNASNGRYVKFQSLPLMSLENLIQSIKQPNFFIPRLEGLFAVQVQKTLANGSAPRRYGKIGYGTLLDSVRAGHAQFANELFLGPVKPVFDVDLKDASLVNNPAAKRQFLNRLIGHLSRRCGYSSNIEDWAIMECFYPDRVSFHLVLNANVHYASNVIQGHHMRSCGVEFREYYIDRNIYNTNAQLRAIGSGKWDSNAYNPFLLMGVPHSEMTSEKLERCLAQKISGNSRLIDVDHLSQIQQFAPNYDDEDVQQIISWLEKIYGQSELDVSAKRSIRNGIRFEVDNLICCEKEHRGAIVIADCRDHRKTLRIQCKEYCKECSMGYTEKSDQYQKQLQMLTWMDKNGFCRLDMCIYDNPDPNFRSFGFFELSPAELCEKAGVDMPEEWVYFYADRKRGNLVDPAFFDFVRDSFGDNYSPTDTTYKRTTELLCSYMTLFVASVRTTDDWYVRTKKGIVPNKKSSVKDEIFGSCCYIVYQTKGRGEDKEVIPVEKPFFPVFEKKGNHCVAGISSGPLDVLSETGICNTPPKQVDARKAMMNFLKLDAANSTFLKQLWKYYLKMLVAYEPEELREKTAEFFEDWVLSVMFDSFTATQICVVLMSAGGGQGKSSMGNFICSFLGSSLSTMGLSANNFFKTNFTGGTNNFIFLDEIFLDHAAADRMKEAITCSTVKIEFKNKNSYQEPNRRNFFATTNKDFVLGVNAFGRERRFFCLKLYDIQQYNEMDEGEFFKWDCPVCPKSRDRFGEYVPCLEHSFSDHGSFILQFHNNITHQTKEKKLVNGPFFDHFAGMLFMKYLEKKDKNSGMLSARLVLTTATQEVQKKVETHAGKFMEFCNERKYHWSPAESPFRLNSHWYFPTADILRDGVLAESDKEWLKWVDLPNKKDRPVPSHLGWAKVVQVGKIRETPAMWIRWVPKHNIYQRYVEWASQNNLVKVSEGVFLDQLEEVSRSRRGVSLSKTYQLVSCEKLTWKTSGGGMNPTFTNSNDPASSVSCFDMGTGPWVKKDVLDGRQSFNLRRSNSAVEGLQDLSRGPALNLSDIIPRNMLNESTRGYVETERERHERLLVERLEERRDRVAVRRAFDEADARDGFEEDSVSQKRSREEFENSDDRAAAEAARDAYWDEQDAIAEVEDEIADQVDDERVRKGRRIDWQADEVEEIESSGSAEAGFYASQ